MELRGRWSLVPIQDDGIFHLFPGSADEALSSESSSGVESQPGRGTPGESAITVVQQIIHPSSVRMAAVGDSISHVHDYVPITREALCLRHPSTPNSTTRQKKFSRLHKH